MGEAKMSYIIMQCHDYGEGGGLVMRCHRDVMACPMTVLDLQWSVHYCINNEKNVVGHKSSNLHRKISLIKATGW